MKAITGGLAALLAMSCLLSGCADTQWQKAGASAQDREHQLTDCEAQALKDLPPDNVAVGRDRTTTGTLKAGDRKVQQETRTDTRIRDENRFVRETLVKDCMYRHGWEVVTVSP